MSKKTTTYVVAILILLLLNVLVLGSGSGVNRSTFDDSRFAVENMDGLQSININRGEEQIQLSKGPESWILNQEYNVDPNFLQVLFSILNQVRVKREVGEFEDDLQGMVTLTFADGDSRSFSFAADPLGTKSYFIEEGLGFQVEVPGYRDNVVNIFGLSSDQWRDRVVFDGSWRTIQSIKLLAANTSLNIQFVDQFFEVEGIAEIDSSAVVDYLNQFQLLQANELISQGRFAELDSLAKTTPFARLSIDDIQNDNPTVFEIFPRLESQVYHLVRMNGGQLMVFDQRRIASILRSNTHFTRQ